MKPIYRKSKQSLEAAKSMRRIRDQLSREIEGMTPQQEVEFSRRKASEFKVRAKRPKAR